MNALECFFYPLNIYFLPNNSFQLFILVFLMSGAFKNTSVVITLLNSRFIFYTKTK
jgi:hypothetical protein